MLPETGFPTLLFTPASYSNLVQGHARESPTFPTTPFQDQLPG
ncbi:hypothetical protein Vi05172_g70 [Venturia inaequalis]|nr:hypothetical protein Vi05172_g70 [Venturia inaequalis]